MLIGLPEGIPLVPQKPDHICMSDNAGRLIQITPVQLQAILTAAVPVAAALPHGHRVREIHVLNAAQAAVGQFTLITTGVTIVENSEQIWCLGTARWFPGTHYNFDTTTKVINLSASGLSFAVGDTVLVEYEREVTT